MKSQKCRFSLCINSLWCTCRFFFSFYDGQLRKNVGISFGFEGETFWKILQYLLPYSLSCFFSLFCLEFCIVFFVYFSLCSMLLCKGISSSNLLPKIPEKKQSHKERYCPSLHPFSLLSSSIFCNLVLLLYMKWIMFYYHKNKREPFRRADSKLPST